MQGRLKVEKGLLSLQWGKGKDFKPRTVRENERAGLYTAFGVTSIPLKLPNSLPALPVRFELNGGDVVGLVLDGPSDQELAAWSAAVVGAAKVVEYETPDEVAARVKTELDLLDEIDPELVTTEQFVAIVDSAVASSGFAPRNDGVAYNSWIGPFRVAVRAALDDHAPHAVRVPPVDPGAVGAATFPLDGYERFRNPFHYVPTPTRTSQDPALADLGEADFAATIGHHRAKEGRYSGRLTIRFHIDTPTLILDHELPVDLGNDHDGYRIAREATESRAPIIQPTTPRGLVRSLVRAVTNSRFQTLPSGRDAERVGYRLGPSAAKRLVPCRLHEVAGVWTAEMFIGTGTTLAANGLAQGEQHAAWLRQKLLDPDPLHNRAAVLAHHGMELNARIRKTHHQRNFDFWQVVQIQRPGQPWGTRIDSPTPRHTRNGPDDVITGIAFVTGMTASNKHDERLFFNVGMAPTRALTSKIIENFADLLTDYATLERDGDIPSQQIAPYIDAHWTVADGMLCYALLEQGQVASLHPALLPRSMHDSSLVDTIDPSLHPADSPAQLSPADRMFGWVKNNGSGAFRSRIAIAAVDTATLVVIESEATPRWMPLDVQSSPKNSPRFAGSPSSNGGAHGTDERQDLRWGKGRNTIRGQKMWVTPTGPEYRSSWFSFERDEHATYQRGPVEATKLPGDNQNRSIDSWIRKGNFDVSLSVKDLTAFELGALLWLFRDSKPLPRPVRYRIGFGKSLGFGVVRPELVDVSLSSTEALQQFWRGLDLVEPPVLDNAATLGFADAFAATLDRDYKGVLNAFDQLRRGYDNNLPLVPPRSYPDRRLDPNGKPERLWYSQNESNLPHNNGRQNLGDAVSSTGLRFFERPAQ